MRLDPLADVGEMCRDFEIGFGGVLVCGTTFCLQMRQSRDMGSPFAALGSDLRGGHLPPLSHTVGCLYTLGEQGQVWLHLFPPWSKAAGGCQSCRQGEVGLGCSTGAWRLLGLSTQKKQLIPQDVGTAWNMAVPCQAFGQVLFPCSTWSPAPCPAPSSLEMLHTGNLAIRRGDGLPFPSLLPIFHDTFLALVPSDPEAGCPCVLSCPCHARSH